ncbi:poly(U)-binding-splicing factor PUF60-like [Tropilaelaps mercedesae]|uniref:Poly(U)-binding-splicing factor PUF60-like n=1 Tax=Tropilaelaps mercedesae TaxID=418985 RepID=A0A1V9Y0P3_9ACAR|nr:poly(U)-binding-splicing factor PUF60-like [Tropilaelaps mercedesae]
MFAGGCSEACDRTALTAASGPGSVSGGHFCFVRSSTRYESAAIVSVSWSVFQGGGGQSWLAMYAMSRPLPTPQANLGVNVWQADNSKHSEMDSKYGGTCFLFQGVGMVWEC